MPELPKSGVISVRLTLDDADLKRRYEDLKVGEPSSEIRNAWRLWIQAQKPLPITYDTPEALPEKQAEISPLPLAPDPEPEVQEATPPVFSAFIGSSIPDLPYERPLNGPERGIQVPSKGSKFDGRKNLSTTPRLWLGTSPPKPLSGR